MNIVIRGLCSGLCISYVLTDSVHNLVYSIVENCRKKNTTMAHACLHKILRVQNRADPRLKALCPEGHPIYTIENEVNDGSYWNLKRCSNILLNVTIWLCLEASFIRVRCVINLVRRRSRQNSPRIYPTCPQIMFYQLILSSFDWEQNCFTPLIW